EEGRDAAFLDIAGDEAFAYASGKDEGQLAALDLLVLMHRGQKTSRIRFKAGDVAYAGRKADRLEVLLDPHGVLTGAQTQVPGKAKRQRHADGDALAVHEPGRIIAGQLFQGVAKSMPEVEERPLTLFCFVGGDDARLGRAADCDRFHARGTAGEDVAPVRFQKLEKVPV